MRGEGPTGRRVGGQTLPAGHRPRAGRRRSLDGADPGLWFERLRDAMAERSPEARGVAEQAVRACPTDPELLLLAALAAMAASQPERALALLKRYQKRFAPGKPITLLTALALAQQRQFRRAWTMLETEGLESYPAAARWFVGADVMQDWLRDRLLKIPARRMRAPAPPAPHNTLPRQADRGSRSAAPGRPAPPVLPPVPELPRLEASFSVRFEIANPAAIQVEGTGTDPVGSGCAAELTRLSLFEGFDELLCLPALQGVEAALVPVETVRKVLKQYRGRVLLADEVGLGKTIEAGMVLKEYTLRGMAERILILSRHRWWDSGATRWRASSAWTSRPATIRCCAPIPRPSGRSPV